MEVDGLKLHQSLAIARYLTKNTGNMFIVLKSFDNWKKYMTYIHYSWNNFIIEQYSVKNETKDTKETHLISWGELMDRGTSTYRNPM